MAIMESPDGVGPAPENVKNNSEHDRSGSLWRRASAAVVKESEGNEKRKVGGSGDGRDGDEVETASFKFAYRPSVPAHRRIKESPLSSDAIFK